MADQTLRIYDTDEGVALEEMISDSDDNSSRAHHCHALAWRTDGSLLLAASGDSIHVARIDTVPTIRQTIPLAAEKRSLDVHFLSPQSVLSIEADWHRVQSLLLLCLIDKVCFLCRFSAKDRRQFTVIVMEHSPRDFTVALTETVYNFSSVGCVNSGRWTVRGNVQRSS